MEHDSSILTLIAVLMVFFSISCVISRIFTWFNCKTNEDENRIENTDGYNDDNDVPPRYEDIIREPSSVNNYDTMIHR